MRTALLFALAAAVAAPALADAPKNKQELKKELRQKLREQQKQAEAKAAAAQAAKVNPPAKPVKPAARPAGPKDPAAVARTIDSAIIAELSEQKVPASPLCSDSEFLRRAYLDLTGVIPPADKARAFLDSTAPDKRARLIDELLADPNFGRHLADIWQAKLTTRESNVRFVPREPFVDWLAAEFNANTPWDKFVTKLITATGSVEDNPATTYFQMNRSIDKIADGVTQHFLGIQLQCAQCHNHPFTAWKQTEYWGMAAFFEKVVAEKPKNTNKNGGNNLDIGVKETATRNKAKDFFPEAAKTVPPKFLGGPEPKLSAAEPYRPALAAWMTSADNPYFARAMVNRTWAQLFGRGFVHPVDDMHEDNPASHPELLAALSAEFAGTGFDLKHLYRSICRSQAYQRTSRPTAGNESDEELFSHQALKVMTPEQLYDSLTAVTKAAAADAKGKEKVGKQGPVGPRAQFIDFYLGGADMANPVEYDAGIPQALRLMNNPKFTGNSAVVRALAPVGAKPAAVIETIYLTALARRPTPAETAKLTAHVAKAPTPADGYGDILWAVLNSSEFAMIR